MNKTYLLLLFSLSKHFLRDTLIINTRHTSCRLWLVTWHLGLFIVLTFGQIGFKGRTEDYFWILNLWSLFLLFFFLFLVCPHCPSALQSMMTLCYLFPSYQECAWRANHLLPGKEGETNMRNLIAISQAKTEKIKQG